jgi:hypothetical protein
VDRYWQEHKEAFIFGDRINSYEKYFKKENMIVKLYDKTIYGGSIVHGFLGILDILTDGIRHLDKFENESLIPELICLAGKVNANSIDEQARRIDMRKILDFSQEMKSYLSKRYISKLLEREIIDFYAESNIDFSEYFSEDAERDKFVNGLTSGAVMNKSP